MRVLAGLLAVLVVSACGDDTRELIVFVQTDLAPTYEAAGVFIEVEGQSLAVFFEPEDQLLDPAYRVGSFRLEDGSYEVAATLRGSSGVLLQRRVLARVAGGDTAITIFLARQCVGVVCPDAAGSPDAVQCLGGACVPTDCVDGTESSCGEPVCSSDSDCPSPSECAVGRCQAQGCVVERNDGLCAAGEFCSALSGCLRQPEVTGDAGQERDSGMPDAAEMDSGELDAGAPDSGETDAGATDTGFDAGVPRDQYIDIAAAERASCAVRSDGSVWCWGMETNGILGNDYNVPVALRPVRVIGLSSAQSIDCFAQHCCALIDDDAALVCWGSNESGAVENDPMSSGTTPIPFLFSRGVPLAGFKLGLGHTCLLRSMGAGMYCQGANDDNQLSASGPGDVTLPGANTRAIAAGSGHSCASQDGTVYCWGDNRDFQLGNPGPGTATPTVVMDVAGVSELDAGRSFTLALNGAGELAQWGALGSLGTATPTSTGISNPETFSAGGLHACAVVQGGEVRCWGNDAAGQVSGTAGNTSVDTPATVAGAPLAIDVAAGYDHSCLIDTQGRVWCWGNNMFGQLGIGMMSDEVFSPRLVFPP